MKILLICDSSQHSGYLCRASAAHAVLELRKESEKDEYKFGLEEECRGVHDGENEFENIRLSLEGESSEWLLATARGGAQSVRCVRTLAGPRAHERSGRSRKSRS